MIAIEAKDLRAFVERIERLESEIHILNDEKKMVYSEAKASGFDVGVLKKVIGERRKDRNDRIDFEEVFDLYWNAIHDE